ncbi:MAG: GGDEF domain-containing protein [Comamonadaceae bacterium]|nr:MAG: GGDEF domain-containing protein [Comamonadaceae bacterium]
MGALALCGLLLAALTSPSAHAVQAPPQAAPLDLQEGMQPIDLWQHVTLRSDPGRALQVQDLLHQPDTFGAPPHTGGALGVRTDAVWLRAALQARQSSLGHWVVQVDYALLHELDIYLTRQGRVVQHAALGNLQPAAPGSLQGRTPAMALDLEAGEPYELLIRVRTGGGMIVPLVLGEAHQLLPAALREQMLQGMFTGLAVCLLLYSISQWVSLRERLFFYYALLVAGSAGFCIQFFGVGSQFLWADNLWLELHVASLCGFLAVTASFLFMGHALSTPQPGSPYLRTMQIGAAVTAALGLAFALDIVQTRAAMALLSVLGPLPSVLSVPMALRHARQGNPLGGVLLLAWATYLAAAVILGLLVQGTLPVNAWTLHAFQLGAAIDMLLFMRMLGLRTAVMRAEAAHASRERDVMRSLAHSDPLTDLPNRRGLDMALNSALPRSRADKLVAVYVLDLDGFKPVNDRYGHAVGDQLLIAVTERLRDQLRHVDTIARIGGDEFVVMACDLPSPEQAQELGTKLLESFRVPFRVHADSVQVGLTIGYALAPLDGGDAATLIKLADAAMYTGKQAGKFCLRRNTGDLALSST